MTQSYNLSQLANNLNTAGQLDATDGLSGAVPATNGGTGQSTYTVGDVLYASTSTALSKLADVATGNALLSGGVGAAPAYGKVGLATHVSGQLPIANGGTGQTTAALAGAALGAIGVGQTWQDMTSSRSFATAYVNTTGRPIYVAASTDAYDFTTIIASIDLVIVQIASGSWAGGSHNSVSAISMIVPAGATYKFDVSYAGSAGSYTRKWFELR